MNHGPTIRNVAQPDGKHPTRGCGQLGSGWIVSDTYEAGANEFGRPPRYEWRVIPPLLIWRFISVSTSQGVSMRSPFSTRAFISEYAVSISLLRAAASVAVPGLSFTWRMNLPVPCNKRAGSSSAAP